MHSAFRHAVKNHSGVECCPFDGRKQLVLRGALQIPSECYAAQVGIYKNGAIAIVPGHAQQSCLTGAIFLKPAAKCLDVSASTHCNGAENIADRRKSSLNPGALRMHAAVNDATNARHEIHRWRDPD